MLAIESPIFAWTELGYLLREDGRLGKTIPGRYLVGIFGGFLGFHFISEYCGNTSLPIFALVSDNQSRKMILKDNKIKNHVNAEVGSKRRLYAETNKSIDPVSLTTHGTPYQQIITMSAITACEPLAAELYVLCTCYGTSVIIPPHLSC